MGYQKAIVAVVGAVVAVLHSQGVDVAEDVSAAVISLATALAVYLVPNQ